MTEMLIDRYLPAYHTTIIEHLVVDAPVADVWSALLDLDLATVHSPLLDAAFFVRGVPARLAELSGAAAEPSPPQDELHLRLGADGPGPEGWLSLGRIDEHEVAFGAIGRFWQPDIDWYDVAGMTPEEFAAFEEPGWGRIAAGFTLRDYGDERSLVSYEARTATTDADARRRFERYWRVVRPFVGHIMRAALATLDDNVSTRRPEPAGVA